MAEPPASPPVRHCLNCGAALTGDFCVDCGQRASTERLSLSSVCASIAAALSFTDGRFLRTLAGITRAPGATARAYVEGRRIPYVGPFAYALLTSAAWLLAFRLQALDRATAEGEQELAAWFVEYGQLLNLALVPLLGLGVHVAFLGTRTRLAEHLCVTLYVVGHAFLVRALLVALVPALGISTQAAATVDQLTFPIYIVAGLWGFHRETSRPLPRALRILLALVLIVLLSQVAMQLVLWITGVELAVPAAPEGAAPTD